MVTWNNPAYCSKGMNGSLAGPTLINGQFGLTDADWTSLRRIRILALKTISTNTCFMESPTVFLINTGTYIYQSSDRLFRRSFSLASALMWPGAHDWEDAGSLTHSLTHLLSHSVNETSNKQRQSCGLNPWTGDCQCCVLIATPRERPERMKIYRGWQFNTGLPYLICLHLSKLGW